MPKKIITIRDIDTDIWKDFKILCIKEDVKIPDKLNEILKNEINR